MRYNYLRMNIGNDEWILLVHQGHQNLPHTVTVAEMWVLAINGEFISRYRYTFGISVKNYHDPVNDVRGIKEAIKRALTGFNRIDRTAVWENVIESNFLNWRWESCKDIPNMQVFHQVVPVVPIVEQ